MRKFIMSLTTVASLSLAAVPVLGLASTAHAAGPVARIAVGDLDLRDPAQAATFDRRVDQEGRKLCRKVADARTGLSHGACMTQVRAVARAELSGSQRRDLILAVQGQPVRLASR